MLGGVRGKHEPPPEISAMRAEKMKKTAEDYLGEPVTEAVITVPAYFNDSQRQATKDAGRIAGLEVKRIINEPTAAALAYGLDKQAATARSPSTIWAAAPSTSRSSRLAEVDGGTSSRCKATNGDTFLGGEDFDQRIIDYLAEEFAQGSRHRPPQGPAGAAAPQGGRREGQDRAQLLADRHQPALHHRRPDGPKHLNIKLTRAKLESWSRTSSSRTIEPCKTAIKDAGREGRTSTT
jgi:molecular chaperone DnaK